MSHSIKILHLGDIVGKPGRKGVAQFLNQLEEKYDFIIANVENASHGFGLTERNYNQLSDLGIHAMTSGNHIWDKKDIFNYIDTADKLLRPLNYTEDVPGVGSRVFRIDENIAVGVINIQGTIFMSPVTPPWELLKQEIKKIQYETPIIVIDFHAEATAEKICCGHIADELSASAVIGTHTHVQTADEKILKNGTAYLTDVGFCGVYESVIGMSIDCSLKRLTTGLPIRFEVAESETVQINGVVITVDSKSGCAEKIERINYNFKLEEDK